MTDVDNTLGCYVVGCQICCKYRKHKFKYKYSIKYNLSPPVA